MTNNILITIALITFSIPVLVFIFAITVQGGAIFMLSVGLPLAICMICFNAIIIIEIWRK